MVISVMRNANPDRVRSWADEYGVTHPILIDEGGGYGDIGIEFSLYGHAPSNHWVGTGAVFERREHRPGEAEIREVLGLDP